MDILQEIIAKKREEIQDRKKRHPLEEVKTDPNFERSAFSMREALTMDGSSHIIAEFKRRSPSKGDINVESDVLNVVKGYQAAGCAGVSILTDQPFFGGSPEDIRKVRSHIRIPILRKDFIVDEYQVFESKAMGADIILLIAEALEKSEVEELSLKAKEIGLEVLLEMHSSDHLHKICPSIDLVGINNRDLKKFKVDIATSLKLAGQIPPGFVKISESGISSADAIIKLMGSGYQGFLIGEHFMKTSTPAKTAEDFIQNLVSLKQLW